MNKISLNQAMRPSLIDSVNVINSIIDELDALDVSGLSTRLSAIEGNISTLQSDMSTAKTDITQVKATLYTPLSEGGN